MVTFENIADDEEENFDFKVEWPPEQRKKICITASGHPWYPCQFGFNGDDISKDYDEKDNFSSVVGCVSHLRDVHGLSAINHSGERHGLERNI